MKLIISIVFILTINFTCLAQNEPETVRGKDLMEKIDRSEILDDEIDGSLMLDEAIPKMEIEKIEFEKPAVKKSTVKKVMATETKPKSKPVVENKETNKKKILVSDRAISLNGLMVNDKLVINDDNTYVYRKVKTNTVQYRFTGKVPTNSKGLKLLSENRYIVENVDLLNADIVPTKVDIVEKTPATPIPKTVSKPETKVVKASQNKPLSNTDKFKKKLENEYTRGNEITETITKEELLKNDIVHVLGEVQLVIRRNRNSYEMEYFWLPELLKLNPKALKSTPFRAMSNNRFKVIEDL